MSEQTHRLMTQEQRAWWTRFRALLDDQYEWPADYVFKFIVPKEQVPHLRDVLGDVEVTIRASSRGRYHSVTVQKQVASAEEVISVYTAVGEVEGVVSL